MYHGPHGRIRGEEIRVAAGPWGLAYCHCEQSGGLGGGSTGGTGDNKASNSGCDAKCRHGISEATERQPSPPHTATVVVIAASDAKSLLTHGRTCLNSRAPDPQKQFQFPHYPQTPIFSPQRGAGYTGHDRIGGPTEYCRRKGLQLGVTRFLPSCRGTNSSPSLEQYQPSDAIDVLRARWIGLEISRDESVRRFDERFKQIRTYLDVYDPETEALLVRADKDKLAANTSACGILIAHLDMLAIVGKEVTLQGA